MMGLTGFDILIIVVVAVGIIIGILFFLNRWATSKMSQQQHLLDSTSQTVSIYVIDKKKERASNTNLPKSVLSQMPKRANIAKLPFVKAKIGPQIMTLMCDKKVYDALPIKKNVTVVMSGIYITDIKGQKLDTAQKKSKK